jgi:hypothetical protein
MLAALPARRLLTVLPLAVFIYGCSDPSTAPAPRIDAKPHTLLAPVVTVTNTDDAGPGSLRQAILDAEPGSTIQFDAAVAGQTIALSTGPLLIDKSLTIEGSAPNGMTISGSLVDKVIVTSSSTDVTLRNLSIVDGKSTSPGGGILAGGNLTLDHSLVANNEAVGKGGGGILLNNAASTLVLLNSTVSENVSLAGGGIFAVGYVVSRNSTIVGNVAVAEGGGLLADAVSLRNTIIANNTADTRANCSVLVSSSAYFGTNISNDATCGFGLVADPVIGPLAANGGPTRTHALLISSPAIDGGTACTEASDQRYVARPQGSSCDVGAFEFNAFRPVTLTVNPNVAVNAKTGTATVAGTISCNGPAATPIRVVLSQTQKTTGKFTTIVQATVGIPFTCVSTPTSWSMQLAPATGKFEPGAATGTVSTLSVPGGYLPANVVASLKLFQVK